MVLVAPLTVRHGGGREEEAGVQAAGAEEEAMISWEGSFHWQGYALSGRPDFLNYLYAGDVTWEGLWDFYRQQTPPQEAVRSLMRLFHIFLSREYDNAGCWLDAEGEVCARLRSWASFAQDIADRVSVEEVQADLAGLVGAGLVTPLYYQAAYMVFMEIWVDRHASAWTGEEEPLDEAPDLPEPDERHLPVYHPGSSRFTHLQGDPTWDSALRSLVSSQYSSWNSAYAATLPDPDHEEAWTMAGGEG
jgi:hypothetical protein